MRPETRMKPQKIIRSKIQIAAEMGLRGHAKKVIVSLIEAGTQLGVKNPTL